MQWNNTYGLIEGGKVGDSVGGFVGLFDGLPVGVNDIEGFELGGWDRAIDGVNEGGWDRANDGVKEGGKVGA